LQLQHGGLSHEFKVAPKEKASPERGVVRFEILRCKSSLTIIHDYLSAGLSR